MHVVLLLGSSTAGKSSLCRELVAEHKWSSNSGDEVWEKILPAHSAKLKPLMLEELKKQDLMVKLQSFMTEGEIHWTLDKSQVQSGTTPGAGAGPSSLVNFIMKQK